MALTGLMMAACNNCPPLNDTQKAEIISQLTELYDSLAIAVEKANADSYLAFWSQEEFLGMHSQSYVFNSKEEYADSVKSWFTPRESMEMRDKTVKVHVLSADLALVDKSSVFLITFKDGNSSRVKHVMSFVLKMEPSGWKVIHGHETWSEI